MGTLTKYHLKEYSFYTLVFYLIFSILITLIQGILRLQKFIDLSPPFHKIVQFFILMYFQLIPFTLPLASFMGVIFAIHRFKEDRELLGFYSLGFSTKDLVKPLVLFGILAFILVFIFNFWVLPLSKRTLRLMKYQLMKAEFSKPFPSKKPIPIASNYVLYVKRDKRRKGKHELKYVFLYNQANKNTYLFVAENGTLIPREKTLILENGWSFSLEEKKTIGIIRFKRYQFKLPLKTVNSKPSFSRGEQTLKELTQKIKKSKPGSTDYYSYLDEYWSRFLYPLSIFFLIFEGFVIARWIGTSHKFLLFFIGVGSYTLFYIFYDLFLSLGKNGRLTPPYNFLIFYIVTFFVLLIQILIFSRKKEVYL